MTLSFFVNIIIFQKSGFVLLSVGRKGICFLLTISKKPCAFGYLIGAIEKSILKLYNKYAHKSLFSRLSGITYGFEM